MFPTRRGVQEQHIKIKGQTGLSPIVLKRNRGLLALRRRIPRVKSPGAPRFFRLCPACQPPERPRLCNLEEKLTVATE